MSPASRRVPGDRLPFAVLVRREQELVGVLQLALQPGNHLLLVRVDDVVRLELVLEVDAERAEALPFLLRDVGGALRQVTDVTDAGLDDELGTEVPGDRLRLGGRFDYDQFLGHTGETR